MSTTSRPQLTMTWHVTEHVDRHPYDDAHNTIKQGTSRIPDDPFFGDPYQRQRDMIAEYLLAEGVITGLLTDWADRLNSEDTAPVSPRESSVEVEIANSTRARSWKRGHLHVRLERPDDYWGY